LARVEVSTYLDAHPERVWQEVNTIRLLRFVAAPLLTFKPIDPPEFPEVFPEGRQLVSMRFRGVLPIGRQVIDVSRPAARESTRFIRDNGHSALIRRWDHLIAIAPEGVGTRYTDTVEIEAGVLTGPVLLFARSFYRHRQMRWRQLVATGFDYSAA